MLTHTSTQAQDWRVPNMYRVFLDHSSNILHRTVGLAQGKKISSFFVTDYYKLPPRLKGVGEKQLSVPLTFSNW